MRTLQDLYEQIRGDDEKKRAFVEAMGAGTAEDLLDLSAPVAAGAAPGLYAATVAGLAPGRTWYFAPVGSDTCIRDCC